MRVLLLLLVALTLLAAAVAVAVLGSRDESRSRFRGAVTVLGDSLNVGLEPYLEDELEGGDLRHVNRVGKTTGEGLDELRTLDDLAPALVISLGTNDGGLDSAAFGGLVDDVLREAGPNRCVVWSTIWLGDPNEPFNDVLRAAARRHRNLELDDWASLVASRPELLAADGVHGSAEGYAERAERIARIVERCYPRPPSSP
jgi:lysophospholipase L1-like esterase